MDDTIIAGVRHLHLVIINPFDTLPGESFRPQRYTCLYELLRKVTVDVTWLISDFHHWSHSRRSVGRIPSLGRGNILLVKTLPYKRNISIRRFIGLKEEGRGDGEAKGLGGLEIDDQFELHRLLHWQVAGVGPLENLVDIGRRTAPATKYVVRVRHQATCLCADANGPHGGQPAPHGEFVDPLAVGQVDEQRLT